MKILLERNSINPNTPDKDDRMSLSFALQDGHEGVVRVLLERSDVNPNTAGRYGLAPL